MKKIFLFKLLISFFLMLFLSPLTEAKTTYVSLAPSVTEIIYALGQQDGLIGVSDRCDYPMDAKNKEKIGSNYGINKEKILKLKPEYTFALLASKPFLSELESVTKFVYFDFNSVEDIFNAIRTLGKMFEAEERAESLVASIKKDIKSQAKEGKSVLYVIQSQPLITIGKKSYLTDVIKLSGNFSATSDINGHYPSISREYAVKLSPHYVVVGPYADVRELKTFLKNSKFIEMNNYQNDIINRPGPRIGGAIKFFRELK